jgi:hypothetical protein
MGELESRLDDATTTPERRQLRGGGGRYPLVLNES